MTPYEMILIGLGAAGLLVLELVCALAVWLAGRISDAADRRVAHAADTPVPGEDDALQLFTNTGELPFTQGLAELFAAERTMWLHEAREAERDE